MINSFENTRKVKAIRMSTGNPPSPEESSIVVEQPVTLVFEDIGEYTLLCMPTDLVALAVGFAFTEGMIAKFTDVDSICICEDDPGKINVYLSNAVCQGAVRTRNMIISSSCGMCGTERIDAVLDSLDICQQSLRVTLPLVLAVHEEMKSRQTVFHDTGGTHAAAIFNPNGGIVAFAEDIGRHNAVDKAIGMCLLSETPTAGCGLAFSGRANFEIVVKAARAGIELIAVVSAPSSLAIKAAERSGITLCGFVRENRLTIYTHESRILTGK